MNAKTAAKHAATLASDKAPVSEMISILKVVHESWSVLDQEAVSQSDLDIFVKILIRPRLLKHKDQLVRLYTANCVAHLLRLYAPEAPYDASELSEVFKAFVGIWSLLADPQGPFFALAYALLDNVATVRSTVLALESSHSKSLVLQILHLFFKVYRHDHTKNVRLSIIDIMTQLFEECESVEGEWITAILEPLLLKTVDHPSVQLSLDLIHACSDRLQPFLGHFFAEKLSSTPPDNEKFDFEAFKKYCALIYKIFLASFKSLSSVYPVLESSLCEPRLDIRLQITMLVGKMVSQKDSGIIQHFPTLYSAWKKRSTDKVVDIRAAWIDAAFQLYLTQRQEIPTVNAILEDLVVDSDERIRVRVFQKLQALLNSQGSEFLSVKGFLVNLSSTLLAALVERCRDKKESVRKHAFGFFSNVAQLHLDQMEQDFSPPIQLATWLKDLHGVLLQLIYIPVPDIRAEYVQQLDQEYMLQSVLLGLEHAHRAVDRYRLFFSYLDEKSLAAFENLIKLKSSCFQWFTIFCDFCEKSSTELSESRLDYSLSKFSRSIPETLSAFSSLSILKELSEFILSCPSDSLSKVKEAVSNIDTKSVTLLTMRLNELLAFSKNTAAKARLIDLLSKVVQFVAHPLVVKKLLSCDTPPITLLNRISRLVPQVTLTLLDTYHRLYFESKSMDESVFVNAIYYCLKCKHLLPLHLSSRLESALMACCSQPPTSPQLFKHITFILCKLATSQDHLTDLISMAISTVNAFPVHSLAELSELEQQQMLCSIQSLSVLAREESALFDLHGKDAFQHLNKLVFSPFEKSSSSVQSNDSHEKQKGSELPLSSKIRIAILKLDLNRVKGALKRSGAKSQYYVEMRARCKRLFSNIMVRYQDPALSLLPASLKVKAGHLMLDLLSLPSQEPFKDCSSPELIHLFQKDDNTAVRSQMLRTLYSFISKGLLRFSYWAPYFIVCTNNDDESELRSQSRHFLQQLANAYYVNLPESFLQSDETLPMLLYFLAVHSEFSASHPDILSAFLKELEFYFQMTLQASNLSYMFAVTVEVKKSFLVDYPEKSQNLYCLAELAQLAISSQSHRHGWRLTPFSLPLVLPSAIYRELDATSQEQNARHLFLPESFRLRFSNPNERGIEPQGPLPSYSLARKHRADKDAPRRNEEQDQDPAEHRRLSLARAAKETVKSYYNYSDSQNSSDLDNDEHDNENEMNTSNKRISLSLSSKKSLALVEPAFSEPESL